MGSAVSSAGRGGRTPTIKLLRALRHSQFHSYQSTGLTRERDKMTISCDIPTQMIVDDLSSSSSSPEQTNNLAEVMKARRRKKKKRSPMVGNTFTDLYKLTGQSLGEGSYGKVENCVNVFTGIEYAVKIIEKVPGFFNSSKILKEIEIYYLCRGQENIIQLIEYFEEPNCFYPVFEKMLGGPLLDHIQRRVCFTEAEASRIVRDLAGAVGHLHKQGIAHRDLKPDNVLCANANSTGPVKLCDFDLCLAPISIDTTITPTLLSPVGSLEYMAPEVVDTFLIDDYDDDDAESICYNKKCDLWSLGVIMYILLCGYAPFSGNCGLDCGWDRGESCTDCQERLFSSIKEGRLVFPDQHWSSISPQAKDLIQRLLGPLRGQQQQPHDPHHPEEADQHQGPRGLCQQGHGGQQGRGGRGREGEASKHSASREKRDLVDQTVLLPLLLHTCPLIGATEQEEKEQGELLGQDEQVLLHRRT